jgi:o-succinylbenzoate synthase
MKVAGARLLRFRIPFRQPYATARGNATVRQGFIVELRSDSGIEGLGEASLLPDAGGDFEAFGRAVETSVRAALGREVAEIVEQRTAAGPAGAGAETAAWDLLARSRQRPLALMLAASPAGEVEVNALVTAASPESVYEQASAACRAGFDCLKLKVGVSDRARDEIERVKAARSAIGPDRDLRLDANGAWDEATAFHMIKNFAPYEVEYIEQPIPPGDLDAFRRLRDSTRVPLAADEELVDEDAANRVLRSGAADVLVLKPLALGGISPARRIAAAAFAAGVRVTFTTSIDTAIGTAAALHLAAAIAPDTAHGLGTLHLLESPLTRAGPSAGSGVMALPEAPGLGVDLDTEAVARYCEVVLEL